MSKKSNGEGSISHRANGTWLAQISLYGRRISRTFKTNLEAKEWVNEISDRLGIHAIANKKREENIEDKIKLLSKEYENGNGRGRITANNGISRLRKYKLTTDQYNSMFELQDGKCAICGKEFIKTPHIDHDHITGKVRGILCRNCNQALGFIGDSPVLAMGLSKYLIEHEARGIPWKEFDLFGTYQREK